MLVACEVRHKHCLRRTGYTRCSPSHRLKRFYNNGSRLSRHDHSLLHRLKGVTLQQWLKTCHDRSPLHRLKELRSNDGSKLDRSLWHQLNVRLQQKLKR
jgi:hypothetical protein